MEIFLKFKISNKILWKLFVFFGKFTIFCYLCGEIFMGHLFVAPSQSCRAWIFQILSTVVLADRTTRRHSNFPHQDISPLPLFIKYLLYFCLWCKSVKMILKTENLCQINAYEMFLGKDSLSLAVEKVNNQRLTVFVDLIVCFEKFEKRLGKFATIKASDQKATIFH